MNKIQKINQLIAEKADGRYLYNWLNLLLWKCVYGGGIPTYFNFELYKLNSYEKRKYWTSKFQRRFEKKWNSDASSTILLCKEKFNAHFQDFVNRDWLYVPECTYEEFHSFVNRHPVFIIKHNWLCEGAGVEKMDMVNITMGGHALYEKLKNEYCLIEEVIEQHPQMASLNPQSVNTIRLATLCEDGNVYVVAAALRCGRGVSCTDNLHGGGICMGVDIESGIVHSNGYDGNCIKYLKHPETGVTILGFQIPFWSQVLEEAKKAHLLLPKVRWIGWDIAVTPNGVDFVEGNTNQGEDLAQIGNTGLHARFKELGIKEL